MIKHQDLKAEEIRRMIKDQSITLAGNVRQKIYGRLDCTSGKRMKKQNRVFFTTEMEAILSGFRPCGHCTPNRYRKWKDEPNLL